jgi:hypothetical protein
MGTQIRVAHSKRRDGFTVFSFEATQSPRYGLQRAGWHMASADTLAEARALAMQKIAADWQGLGLPIPPVTDCGRVADAIGRAWAF